MDQGPSRGEILAEVDAVLDAASDDPLTAVCSLLRKSLPSYSWVGVYGLRDKELRLLGWAGHQATEHTRIPVGKGICGLAARTGQSVNVPDVHASSEYLACFPETRSELVVPILHDGVVVGEIDIDSFHSDAFDDADEALCEALAERLAPIVVEAVASLPVDQELDA